MCVPLDITAGGTGVGEAHPASCLLWVPRPRAVQPSSAWPCECPALRLPRGSSQPSQPPLSQVFSRKSTSSSRHVISLMFAGKTGSVSPREQLRSLCPVGDANSQSLINTLNPSHVVQAALGKPWPSLWAGLCPVRSHVRVEPTVITVPGGTV